MTFLPEKQIQSHITTLCWVTLSVGITSGLSGMFLALLLHFIQHLAFGYAIDTLVSSESFLEGVRASSSLRRVLVLILCGLVAGFGWWGIYRFGKPLVSIAQALRSNRQKMPFLTTLFHVLLQIITIALGSPLGREVAPRELSALIASKLTAFANLSPIDTRIMFACGAGAGLAAVYNVPLSGAVYVLEVLLCTWSPSALFPALATSFIAVVISWIGLGNVPQYHLPHFSINLSLAIWAILAGPLFGLSAYWFKKIADLSHQHMPHHWKLPVFCLLNFILIGVLAIAFPELLGNGKSPAQLAFDARLGIGLAAIIFILHTLTVWSSLWAGAQGGLLTPSLANGALLAMVFGGLWNEVAPPSELGAYALIGATVFLAEAQSMPITALILLFEFTHPSFEVLIPTILAIVGSVGLGKIIRAHRAKDH